MIKRMNWKGDYDVFTALRFGKVALFDKIEIYSFAWVNKRFGIPLNSLNMVNEDFLNKTIDIDWDGIAWKNNKWQKKKKRRTSIG